MAVVAAALVPSSVPTCILFRLRSPNTGHYYRLDSLLSLIWRAMFKIRIYICTIYLFKRWERVYAWVSKYQHSLTTCKKIIDDDDDDACNSNFKISKIFSELYSLGLNLYWLF